MSSTRSFLEFPQCLMKFKLLPQEVWTKPDAWLNPCPRTSLVYSELSGGKSCILEMGQGKTRRLSWLGTEQRA